MSKRKPDDDIDVIKEEKAQAQVIPTPVRAAQMCNKCHQPKAARSVIYNGAVMPIPHAKSCAGRCINPDTCIHKSHRVGRKKVQKLDAATKQAILAGFKPQEDTDFKQKWEAHLQKNGLSSTTLPGPAQLDMMIKACHAYAIEQVQHAPATTSMSSESANSVVRLFESASTPTATTTLTSTPKSKPTSTSTSTSTSISTSTPTSTPTWSHKTMKLQCNNCSWMCDGDVKMLRTNCEMCTVGDMVTARAGATFSPMAFKSAINIIRATSTSTSTATATATATATSTSTSSHPITPMDPHDIHDLTFDCDDDDDDTSTPFPFMLPIKKHADASTQTEPSVATVETQTNHTMEFPHLKTSTSSPLMKLATVSSAYACKKPLAPCCIQSNKENMPHAANTSA